MKFKEFELDGFTYRSSKLLMLVAFFVLLSYALFVFNYSGWSGKTYYYTECPNETKTGKCVNAFYGSNLCDDKHIDRSDPLCTERYLAEGSSLGEKAPWFIQDFKFLSIGFMLLILLLNTLIFNKGFFSYLRGKFNGP